LNKKASLIFSLSMLALSTHVLAENDYYMGLKGGQVSTELPNMGFGTINDSDPGTGFIIGRAIGAFGAEFEYLTAEVNSKDISITEIEIDTIALYGVYRSISDLYFKAKLGILSEKAAINSIYGNGQTASDTGLSYGLGGGYQFSNFFIEGEYIIIEADVDYISMTAGYYF